ncbi:hypothetical protein [Cupriavidus pampae]|uniref:Uncharacterized protein n=1 Tax=Cupriavidus pampae TaxID=659251 RepID=A0ABN7ZJF1_9BURK|nr:hypothetical protein [Cupriavidus pampae]CAG9186107.1 hypothetical protein LMG32289_06264 [Cupriavidus pampae]
MIIKLSIPAVHAPNDPFLGYWGKQAFLGHFSDNPFVTTIASTYVRCVFAAREDYQSAAEHLKNYWEGDGNALRVSELYRAITRLESCITAMYLAVRALRQLRKRRELTERERAVICAKKAKPRFLGSDGDLLGQIRNKIQHIEEELAEGKVSKDLPFMIVMTGPEVPVDDPRNPGQVLKTIDRLQVHKFEVRFAELAAWLGEMVDYVDKLHSLMPIEVNSVQGKVFAPLEVPPQ